MNALVQENLRGLDALSSRCKGISQSEDVTDGGFRVMGESLWNLFPLAPSLFGLWSKSAVSKAAAANRGIRSTPPGSSASSVGVALMVRQAPDS